METSPDSDSNVPDRHSMEMSVINGLKNLKDFRGEITLLNIENSPGPNHRKCKERKVQTSSFDELFNLFGR